ncbi:PREDICTED: remorin isoform X2 [Theobroma cacao]|uniref:Remorin isoform X2 n=1 Tax=Theobroma cacao TaxID=3641 RepID=A0AB32W2D2_THECC|nr:PREDICTED: remorin isoform X2 [Theobroma cacao]
MGEEEANKMEASEPKEQQPVKEEKDAAAKTDVAEEKSLIPVPENSVLARVETEKRLALLKAWEENEKAKVENKAHKKISAIGSWENTKKAGVEAQLKKIEEQLEKKKAEYAEKMKNRVAEIHREAEEKRAMIEAKRGEDFLKIEETAAKFRATGYTPKKFLGCFSS